MKNNKNIRKLKFDISVRPAKEAVPESGNTMYHEDQLYHARTRLKRNIAVADWKMGQSIK